ncbi:MAG: putative DNA-binding domain-containing protein [Terracidiphilus sp.]
MSSEPMSLAELQREMAAAVMMPLTADEQMRAEAVDGRDMSAVAGSFIAPNSRLSAFERLEIYNRQYWFRVLGALAEDFAILQAVVGGSEFEALSIAYLTAHPSRSFSMRNLGSTLVGWLTENPQYAGRRQRLAIDVARIEWAFIEAFDGAEREPLTLDQIATLDGGSRLALQPHLRLVAMDYGADELVMALDERQKRETSEAGVERDSELETAARLPKLRRKPTWVAVHRVEFTVYFRRLRREEFLTLGALRRGLPLAEALEAGFVGSETPPARRPHRVKEWFANWAALGWVCAPDLGSLL